MGRITVALVAHDAKKAEMVSFMEGHREQLAEWNLVATQGTGELIQQHLDLPVNLLRSGPHGGDQQVGSLVAHGMVHGVIFLRDPLTAQPHEPDITALLRLCDVYNIPLATNRSTAEAVIHLLSLCTEEAPQPVLV